MQLSSLYVESGCIFIIYEIMRIAGAALLRSNSWISFLTFPGRNKGNRLFTSVSYCPRFLIYGIVFLSLYYIKALKFKSFKVQSFKV